MWSLFWSIFFHIPYFWWKYAIYSQNITWISFQAIFQILSFFSTLCSAECLMYSNILRKPSFVFFVVIHWKIVAVDPKLFSSALQLYQHINSLKNLFCKICFRIQLTAGQFQNSIAPWMDLWFLGPSVLIVGATTGCRGFFILIFFFAELAANLMSRGKDFREEQRSRLSLHRSI